MPQLLRLPYTDRAIAHRNAKGFEHLDGALSVDVQKMVRSDRAGTGVLFTLNMDSGFPDVVGINAARAGEPVVQDTVSPDEYIGFHLFPCFVRIRFVLYEKHQQRNYHQRSEEPEYIATAGFNVIMK